jgi:hypothetical protein
MGLPEWAGPAKHVRSCNTAATLFPIITCLLVHPLLALSRNKEIESPRQCKTSVLNKRTAGLLVALKNGSAAVAASCEQKRLLYAVCRFKTIGLFC